MKRNKNILVDLFGNNVVSREEYLSASKKRAERKQREKVFMNDISRFLSSFPHIHIEYYCGNKFWVECKCGNKILAECHKVNNAKNAGAPDLIGIAWAIETKHKVHGKNTKLAPAQDAFRHKLESMKIPFLKLDETNADEILNFISLLKSLYYLKTTCAARMQCGTPTL